MRPETLAKVAQLAAQGDCFDRCLSNFLDGFYANPTLAALTETPIFLAPLFGDIGCVQDCYLAAVSDEVAHAKGFRVRAWTGAENRVLHRPWFASPLAALRATLLLESPRGFRSRNLFVSENALSRE